MNFYNYPSCNPLKVALLLEVTGRPYELVPVDTCKR
jgi:GSH-dependent disulfide-bond oxidoreductase